MQYVGEQRASYIRVLYGTVYTPYTVRCNYVLSCCETFAIMTIHFEIL